MPGDEALEREEVDEEDEPKTEEAAATTTGEPKFAEPAARSTAK